MATPESVARYREDEAVDAHVGATIRLRRKTRGLSQAALAQSIGITFQQIQKYERGANRVSASTLVRLARALKCEVADLFVGLPGGGSRGEDDPEGFGSVGRAFLSEDGGYELAKAFLAAPLAYRRAILAAARALAHLPERPGT